MLTLSIRDIREGVERYYGDEWLFKVLQGATWESGSSSARLCIDGIEINIYEATDVMRIGLWHSNTAHVDTYIGHVDAIDLEIGRLFDRLHNETNYVYERERQIQSKAYSSR